MYIQKKNCLKQMPWKSIFKFHNVQNVIVSTVPLSVLSQSPSIVPVMVTVRELGVVALSMGVLVLASRWFQADM